MTHKHEKTRASGTVSCEMMAADSPRIVPTDDQIRCRAHEIYQARRGSGMWGNEMTDWIAAERELAVRVDDGQPTARVDSESSVSEALHGTAHAEKTNGSALVASDRAPNRVRELSASPLNTGA